MCVEYRSISRRVNHHHHHPLECPVAASNNFALTHPKSARALCAVHNVLTIEVLLDALLRRFGAQHCGGPLVLAVGHVFGRSSSQCGRITLTPSNLGSRGDYLSFGISIIEIGRVVFEIYGRTDTHTYTRDLSWDSPHVNT